MSLAGLRKQINKANQFLSEQMGAAEATKLDEKYHELERKMDVTDALVTDMIERTREYLQPNPATRAKMLGAAYLGKVRGSAKGAPPYPQPEGDLGDCMLKGGKQLETAFGHALCDCGEAYRQIADIKYNMEDTIKQNFLDPLTTMQGKDLKEVAFHRKKLMGRRLDYDCKKRQKATDEEMVVAEEKLEESKKLAETAMWTVLDNDTEYVSQLAALVDAQIDFHKRCCDILESLKDQLGVRLSESAGKTHMDHTSAPVLMNRTSGSSRSRSPAPGVNGYGSAAANNPFTSASHSENNTPAADPWGAAASGNAFSQPAPPSYNQQPSARALYDFEPENEGELCLKEGQVVTLIKKIDANWYEGKLPSGKSGFFPINYVQVLVPLP